MKHKILLSTTLVFTIATLVGLTKFVLANFTGNISPTADGTYAQWTPSIPPTTTPHYTMVDEAVCNGTDDYNYTNTAGDRDSYAVDISSIPNGAIINTITITPCASANLLYLHNSTTPVTSSMALFYKYNNLNSANGSDYNFLSDWNTPTPLSSTVFNNVGLVKQTNSNLEIGAKFNSGLAGARLSQIAINLTYTVPAPPTVGATSVVSTTPTSTGFYAYVNPNGTSTTGWFRYGSTSPGTCNDTFGTRVPSTGGINLGAGTSLVQYFYYNAPLSRDTIYYYCAIAENALGKSFGALKSFKTAP